MNEGVKNQEKELEEINREKEKVKQSTAQDSLRDIRLDTIYKQNRKTNKNRKNSKKGRKNT